MTSRKERLIGVLWALAIAGYFILASAIPADAATQVVHTEDIVFRGGAGETLTVTWDNPAGLVGQSCGVVATVDNGESEHLGNRLDVGPLQATEIEGTAFGQTVVAGTMVIPAEGTATITLSDDPAHQWREGVWVFSGLLTVTVDCAQETTTTTAVEVTTTTVADTTTTTVADTTTTTVVTTTSTVPDETTTTVADTTTTSLITGSTVTTLPPVTGSTLPFTGPEDVAGLAMAGATLLVLGGAIVLATREQAA